jgi:phosphatidylglycerophosphatase A
VDCHLWRRRASLAAAVLFYALWLVTGDAARWIILALLFPVCAVAIRLGSWAQDYFKTEDPRQFVLDEVVGQWAVLLCVPIGQHPLTSVAAGLFLFRAFDIGKPFPIARIERLPGGWGIVLDDAAAAAYAVAAFWILTLVTRALG